MADRNSYADRLQELRQHLRVRHDRISGLRQSFLDNQSEAEVLHKSFMNVKHIVACTMNETKICVTVFDSFKYV